MPTGSAAPATPEPTYSFRPAVRRESLLPARDADLYIAAGNFDACAPSNPSMEQGRLSRYVAGAVVLLLHVLAVLALRSHPPRSGPAAEPQFVSLWPEDPSPIAVQSALAPSSIDAARDRRRSWRKSTPVSESPADETAKGASSDQPSGSIDWRQEAAAVAGNYGLPDRPRFFGKPAPAQRAPCVPTERLWFLQPKLVIPQEAIPIGKNCYMAGQTIQCVARLGSMEKDTEELIAALRDDGGPSVPNLDRCD